MISSIVLLQLQIYMAVTNLSTDFRLLQSSKQSVDLITKITWEENKITQLPIK